jgi:hypothetical protein
MSLLVFRDLVIDVMVLRTDDDRDLRKASHLGRTKPFGPETDAIASIRPDSIGDDRLHDGLPWFGGSSEGLLRDYGIYSPGARHLYAR